MSGSGTRMRPGFLIVGAQRGGTTSMLRTLAQHPAVLLPLQHKGVYYFDSHYEEGLDWYLDNFPTVDQGHLASVAASVAAVAGESSAYYSFHPLAPARIAASLPGVRLIMLLRNPVERAHSAHAHELANGYETEEFERALELEPSRLAGERQRMLADPTYRSYHWHHHAYLTRGQYVEQLEQMAAEVGRERLLVVDSHDFFTRPEPVFADVLAFLGLPPVSGIRFERHNAGPRTALSEAIRVRLSEHFRRYDERLAEWWGRVPSWRR